MNKDIVYIEPEDDITDIIAKIEKAKEKIVALVPPKKAGVLRSIVNIKLIAKSGVNAGKNVVLVTADPSIMRLAATVKIPVAKNLQSAPVIPDPSTIEVGETVSSEEVLEEPAKDEEPEKEAEKEEKEEKADEEEKDEAKAKEGKKDKKSAKKDGPKSSNPVIAWFQTHKKLAIGGGIGLVVFILLLIWAFAIAPAVKVTVSVRTITSNFSENITFTDKMAEEKVSDGVFYLETKQAEEKAEVPFEATGSKNVGEKAHGELIIYKKFRIADGGGTVAISAGSSFKINDLVFTADADSTLSWDGDLKALKEDCENYNESSFNTDKDCLVSRRIAVTAENPGAKYNIAASTTGWDASSGVTGAYSDSAMEGGTDKLITIVQQSDIDAALAKIKSADEAALREKLLSSISEGSFAIESSFKHVVGEPTSTPRVGEEVKEKEKAKLTVTTTDSILVIDKTKMEEFISEKAKLTENYKIYSINDPFVENFTQVETGYIGKLKASYTSGPKVTENEIVDIIKGKGLGVAQHDIKDIDGVGSIRIDTSYPWVMSIPSDPNKISVSIEVEQ